MPSVLCSHSHSSLCHVPSLINSHLGIGFHKPMSLALVSHCEAIYVSASAMHPYNSPLQEVGIPPFSRGPSLVSPTQSNHALPFQPPLSLPPRLRRPPPILPHITQPHHLLHPRRAACIQPSRPLGVRVTFPALESANTTTSTTRLPIVVLSHCHSRSSWLFSS